MVSSEPIAPTVGPSTDRLARDLDRPGIGGQDPRKEMEKRGLSRSTRTAQSHLLTLEKGERRDVHDGERAPLGVRERLLQFSDLEKQRPPPSTRSGQRA